MKTIDIRVIDLIWYIVVFFLWGIILGISLPFIKNWFKKIFFKNKNNIKHLNKTVTEIVNTQSVNDKLKEQVLDRYNKIPDSKKYEFIQLFATREKLKKHLKIIDNEILELEK